MYVMRNDKAKVLRELEATFEIMIVELNENIKREKQKWMKIIREKDGKGFKHSTSKVEKNENQVTSRRKRRFKNAN